MSELSALFLTVGSLSLLGRGRVMVQFSAVSAAVARRIFLLLRRTLGVQPQLHYVTHARFGGRRKCVLTLGPDKSPLLLSQLNMMEPDERGMPRLTSAAPRIALSRSCCQRAYLRGAMLGCGAVISPEKGYHLELVVRSETLGQSIVKCFGRLGLPVRVTRRRDADVYYLKQSDWIVTLLSAIGAHRSVTRIEERRVQGQVLGGVNRAMNCDSANLHKQVDAGGQQVSAIRALIDSGRIDALSPKLREIALARVNNPDLSLTELGRRLDPPLGKSGVSHRMRRLMELAPQNTTGGDAQ